MEPLQRQNGMPNLGLQRGYLELVFVSTVSSGSSLREMSTPAPLHLYNEKSKSCMARVFTNVAIKGRTVKVSFLPAILVGEQARLRDHVPGSRFSLVNVHIKPLIAVASLGLD